MKKTPKLKVFAALHELNKTLNFELMMTSHTTICQYNFDLFEATYSYITMINFRSIVASRTIHDPD
jgi:hypothetical protein